MSDDQRLVVQDAEQLTAVHAVVCGLCGALPGEHCTELDAACGLRLAERTHLARWRALVG